MTKKADVPASIGEIAKALESTDPAVRLAALTHAQALGAEARSLAPAVARRLDDPDPSVAWHVPRAFAAIGRGAGDAVAVLAPMLAPGGDEMRTQRALFCVGSIGPSAQSTLDAVEPLANGTSHTAHAAVGAIVGLAGEAAGGEANERITRCVLAALASADYGKSSEAARELASAPEWLRLRALEDLDARLGPDAHGTTLYAELAPRMKERVLESIARAFDVGGTTGRMAALAVERIPPPLPRSIVDRLVDAAAAGDESFARTLARVGAGARSPELTARALAALEPALRKSTRVRLVGELARALAALAPGSGAVVPHLVDVIERTGVARTKDHTSYDVGALARAIGALADAKTAPRAATVLEAKLHDADALVRTDRSAGLDLQRAVKEGLEALAKLTPKAAKAAKRRTIADAVDARDRREDARRAKTKKLAPIPRARPTKPARPPIELTPLDAKQRGMITAAATRGRTHLLRRITSRSSADAIASAIDATLAFARDRSSKTKTKLPLGDLAALYGQAIVRAVRWRWYVLRDGDRVSYAVVSPSKAHAVLPGELLARQSKPRVELTLLLLFRMIVAKDLPAPRDGDPIVLG